MREFKEGGQPQEKPSLRLIIEGKKYETFNQFMTGLQLKELAGIPPDTELFLSIVRPYKDELIENEKSVNLARPEIENFFVKKKLNFSIDGKPFTWYKQYIRGVQIRELGQIPSNVDIYLDIKEGWEDDLITDEEVVDLARPGKEKFITKPVQAKFTIVVNAQEKSWDKPTISFEQVIELAFGHYDSSPNKGYTVTYFRGHEPKPEGTMVRTSVVRVKNKMVFNATPTDKS